MRASWNRPFTWIVALWLVASVVTMIIPLPQPAYTTRAVAQPATLTPTATPTLTFAPPPALQAQAAYLYDPPTGTTLLDRNGEDERAMASTTKIMTAVVAILTGDPNQQIAIPPDVAQLDATDASRMCCPVPAVGMHFALRDLLYGLLLPSGDDAAIAIAGGVAGSQGAFVTRMNRVATWLGLRQTHYANPHGLDAPDHYTTARDLARLAAFALTLPLFRQIVAQSGYTIPATDSHPAIALVNSNVLLIDGATLGVDGVKTGFTGDAGYCLVLDAYQQGHELIAVLLGDPTDAARFADGAALLRWGLSR